MQYPTCTMSEEPCSLPFTFFLSSFLRWNPRFTNSIGHLRLLNWMYTYDNPSNVVDKNKIK